MARDYMETVRGLLEMSEHPSLEEKTRAHYLERAQELMTKYAIDEATARASGGHEVGTVDGEIWFRDDKTSLLIKAKRELLSGLATIHRCKLIAHGRSGRDYMTLVGFESDRHNIGLMFNSVMLQLQTDMARVERQPYAVVGPVRGWRVSFAHAYVRRVYVRLRDAQARQIANAETATPGTALVLRDTSALVADKFQQMFPHTTKSRVTDSARNAAGYAAGDSAGQRADLGGSRVGGTAQKMI